jgi:hypothetical protein
MRGKMLETEGQMARDCDGNQAQMKTELESHSSLVAFIGTIEQSVSFLVQEFHRKITE